jgi:predicted metal-dependent hydrolase
MEKRIELEATALDYTLRVSARARGVSLTVYPDGRVAVTIPSWGTERQAEEFVRSRGRWLVAVLARVKKNPGIILKGGRREYLRHREAARAIVHERLAHFNALYGFRYKTVSIRDQRSRWGSCSKKGGLSFNFRIALVPRELADYVVVHELCHLKEFNHGPAFWALMARALPNPRALRRELRKYKIG